ncbi:hypothetical protein BGZ97_011518 [Linnemannia gamsii]|uniref:Uncharacterized protein n=1 Tax=Linnemannia gamsii TaxID=64522 RepID=A0A9P6UMY8_9FUNG|nr:hypothetical protein BGZ97_011518 [Linnemannia gamsii]
MPNPSTQTTTTSTTTTTNKPTTMEKVKEKASVLADKITGRQHDPYHGNFQHDSNQPGPGFHGINDTANPVVSYHAGQQPVDALHSADHHDCHHGNQTTTMPLHTGAAVGDAAVPIGNTVDRAAYQAKLDHHGEAGFAGPPVPPKDDHTHHHGFFGHHDKHDKHDTTAFGGAYATDPNLIHPSVVPHQQTTAEGLQSLGASNVAGPTGMSHVPTYSQNIPPTTAGTVPVVGQTAGQVYPSSGEGLMGSHYDRQNQAHFQSTAAGPGPTTTAAGTQVFPMNTNNSTVPMNQQNMQQMAPAPGGVVPQAVPAMGAPGTTTAAGTHMPGQYVA